MLEAPQASAPEELEGVLPRLPALAVCAATAIPQEVLRDDVYCSRIVHQRSTHQSRFTWLGTFRKIMAHAHPDCAGPDEAGKYPRPMSSPLPCFQCHQRFDGPPCFLPIVALNGDRTEYGNFCDPSCANTYLHHNMNGPNLAARYADLFEYVQDVHGFTGDAILFAPHFSELREYGGTLSLEDFRKLATTPGLRTFQRRAPFIPTPVAVEWQCEVAEGSSAAEALAGVVPSTAAAPTHPSGFGLHKHLAPVAAAAPPPPPPDDTPVARLQQVLGPRPEASQHHQWEVAGLRQPPQEQIEARLRALAAQRPPSKPGLYELYCKRRKEEEEAALAAGVPLPTTSAGPPSASAATTAAPKRRTTPKAPSSAAAAGGGGAGGPKSRLTKGLVPAG